MSKLEGGNLVIGRRKFEGLLLETTNGTILVKVMRCGKGRVRLAVQAPRSVIVTRAELVGKRAVA